MKYTLYTPDLGNKFWFHVLGGKVPSQAKIPCWSSSIKDLSLDPKCSTGRMIPTNPLMVGDILTGQFSQVGIQQYMDPYPFGVMALWWLPLNLIHLNEKIINCHAYSY